jgi:hypothetical protein
MGCMTLVLCLLLPFVLAPIEVYLVMIAGVVFGEAYRTGANRPAAEPENS